MAQLEGGCGGGDWRSPLPRWPPPAGSRPAAGRVYRGVTAGPSLEIALTSSPIPRPHLSFPELDLSFPIN